MIHDCARQLESGPRAGKWHYTTQYRDREGRKHAAPFGYCADGCPGHDTADEAVAHYREFVLDRCLAFHDDRADARSLHRCEAPGCMKYTSGYLNVLGTAGSYYLCSDHRNREVAARLVKVGSVWHS